MARRLYSLAFVMVALTADCVIAQGVIQVFDVKKYGAVADGKTDDKKEEILSILQAFLDAWKDACEHKGTAHIVFPAGEYLVGPVEFSGPCPNNILTKVDIKGKLKAIPDIKAYDEHGWIEFNRIHKLFISGGGVLDGQGAEVWKLKKNCPPHVNCKNFPTTLRFNGVNNATLAHLRFVNSKGFHINIHQSTNIKVKKLNITAPADSPNTDGIHISATNNAAISDSIIGTGDDCISIGPGATNLNIHGIKCGPGHGISVGSLGKYKNEKDVSGVTVRNCSLSHTTNGIRLKTWQGSEASKAVNFIFENIVMQNVSNPIIIDQEYCPNKKHCSGGPSRVKIAGVKFMHVSGTTNTPVAVNLLCSKSVPCENVELQDIDLKYVTGEEKTSSSCSNALTSFLGVLQPPPCA